MIRKSHSTGEGKKGQMRSPQAAAMEEVSSHQISSRHYCLYCWPGKALSSQTGSLAAVNLPQQVYRRMCHQESLPCSVHTSWRVGLSHKTTKMYAYACLCARACMCYIYMYTGKLEINFQCYSSPQEPSPCGFELNWLASKPQEPVCLHLLNTGITSVCHHTYFFQCVFWVQTDWAISSAQKHVSALQCSSACLLL